MTRGVANKEDIVVITHLQVLESCVREGLRMSPERDPVGLIDECVEKLGLESPRSVSVMETVKGMVYTIRNCNRRFLIVPNGLVTCRSGRSRLRASFSCLGAGGCGIIFENNEHPVEAKQDGCVIVPLKTIPTFTRCGQSQQIATAIKQMTAVVSS